MDFTMIVYVVRHGEAEGNREGRFLGQVNPPLTERGREHARRMGEALKGRGIERIRASDLDRAFTTASIIGGIIGLAAEPTPALREVNHGVIDGWTAEAIMASPYGPARERDKYNYAPPGGESYKGIEARILGVLDPLPAAPTLLVTHLGPMRVLLHCLGGVSEAEATGAKIGHDEMLILSHDGGHWRGERHRIGQ
jgi:broad specificity phosphatase PhoE